MLVGILVCKNIIEADELTDEQTTFAYYQILHNFAKI